MDLTAGFISIGILGLTLILGMPVGISLLTAGFLGLILMSGNVETALGIFSTGPYRAVADFNLTVLPLFILMGTLAYHGGIGGAAYTVGQKLLGRLRGGLAIATIFGCAGFGAACGSSIATSAVFTKLSLPEMERQGYDMKLACGTIAAGGTLGMLIPPSTLAIIYGILTELPVGKLLIAGIGPGILLAVIFSLGVVSMVSFFPNLAPHVYGQVSWRERIVSLKGMWGIAVLAVIVLGGIYSGVFTPTEAAAVGSGAALIIFLSSRQRSWVHLREAFLETGLNTAMVFLIMIGAIIFGRVLALSGITAEFIDFVMVSNLHPMVIMTCFLAMYLLMGCFLDSISMMALTLPTISPLSIALGFEPIWFALVVIVTIEMGLLTPPMGLNVYVVKAAAGERVTLEDVFRGCIPFFFMMLIGLVMLILIPPIITWLPNMMFE